MSTTDSQIRERVESFVKELEALIRQAAVTAVADVLGVSARAASAKTHAAAAAKAPAAKAAPRKAAPAAKPAKAAKAAKAAKPAAKKPGRPGRPPAARPASSGSRGSKKRIRRTLKELDAVGVRIAEFVAKNPGQRAEQIKKALKLGANDWALPIKKLVDERRISAKGQKRATTYFASK